MTFVRSIVIVTAAALMTVVWPGDAEAQYFRLAINRIEVWGPQDSTESTCPTSYWPNVCVGWDRRDEVYFTVAGVTGQNATVSAPYVPLPPHGSPYGMRTARDGGPSNFGNIPLWNGQWQYLAAGQYAFFVVFVRERDVEPLTLTTAVNNAAAEMRQVRLNAQLPEETAIAQLESVARRLYQNLTADGDDIITTFTVHIRMPLLNPGLMSKWKPLDPAPIPFSQSNWAAEFVPSYNFTNTIETFAGWAYDVEANIQQLISPVVNTNSGKCLDVANASVLNGGNVQQYACSGRFPGYFGYYDQTANQQWILNPWGVGFESIFSLISVNSGLCLDVESESLLDGANVQQYSCRTRWLGSSHQQWHLTFVNRFTPAHEFGYELRNMRSGKCLDVASGSLLNGANVQQFTCHGGTNQLWLPYGYRAFFPIQ
jgi:hypothetical protein